MSTRHQFKRDFMDLQKWALKAMNIIAKNIKDKQINMIYVCVCVSVCVCVCVCVCIYIYLCIYIYIYIYIPVYTLTSQFIRYTC